MRHRIKKIRFKQGVDANQMMMRKLVVNFLVKGKITTTIKRIKALKPEVEKLVEKMKQENEANKNILLSALGDKKLVPKLFKEIGRPLKDKVGGYVRITRLGARVSDSSQIARLEWVYPIVISDVTKKSDGNHNKVDKTDKREGDKKKLASR